MKRTVWFVLGLLLAVGGTVAAGGGYFGWPKIFDFYSLTVQGRAVVQHGANGAASGNTTLDDTIKTFVEGPDLGTVAAGDVVLVHGHARTTKYPTDGYTSIKVKKSSDSTAQIRVAFNNQECSVVNRITLANEYRIDDVLCLFRVTAGGTLKFTMNGMSVGSNTIADGSIYAHVLK